MKYGQATKWGRKRAEGGVAQRLATIMRATNAAGNARKKYTKKPNKL